MEEINRILQPGEEVLWYRSKQVNLGKEFWRLVLTLMGVILAFIFIVRIFFIFPVGTFHYILVPIGLYLVCWTWNIIGWLLRSKFHQRKLHFTQEELDSYTRVWALTSERWVQKHEDNRISVAMPPIEWQGDIISVPVSQIRAIEYNGAKRYREVIIGFRVNQGGGVRNDENLQIIFSRLDPELPIFLDAIQTAIPLEEPIQLSPPGERQKVYQIRQEGDDHFLLSKETAGEWRIQSTIPADLSSELHLKGDDNFPLPRETAGEWRIRSIIPGDLSSVFDANDPVLQLTNLDRDSLWEYIKTHEQGDIFKKQGMNPADVIAECKKGTIFQYQFQKLSWLFVCLTIVIFLLAPFLSGVESLSCYGFGGFLLLCSLLLWLSDQTTYFAFTPSGFLWDRRKRNFLRWTEIQKIEEIINYSNDNRGNWPWQTLYITDISRQLRKIERIFRESTYHGWVMSIYSDGKVAKRLPLNFFRISPSTPFLYSMPEFRASLAFHLYASLSQRFNRQ